MTVWRAEVKAEVQNRLWKKVDMVTRKNFTCVNEAFQI